MLQTITRKIPVFALILMLSACGPTDFSPEAVAVKMLLQHASNGMALYQDTVQVRQKLEMDDSQAIVMLTYQGNRPDMGEITCYSTYETSKGAFGWMVRHSSGSCRELTDQTVQAVEFGGGSYSGQRAGDPGFSLTSGLVHDADIVRIRVTWDDNQVTEAEVVNGTVITGREGKAQVKLLEGLNAEGEVLFSYFREDLPGDRP